MSRIILLITILLFSICYSKNIELEIDFTRNNTLVDIPKSIERTLGILNGFSNTSGVFNALPTLKNLKEDDYRIIGEFFETYTIFNNITYENYVDMITVGAEKLSILFFDFANVIGKSFPLKDEVTDLILRIVHVVKNKEYYISFLKNLVSDQIFEIFRLIEKIKLEYAGDNYFEIGSNMGTLFSKIFIVDYLI